MKNLTISLPDKDVEKLQERASQLNLSVEQLLAATAHDLLSQSDDEFQRAMEYVLKKNEELYRRLA